jgi:hypothetical protein
MKQETLEEAAQRLYTGIDRQVDRMLFIKGAKWQQEQDKKMYTKEEVGEILYNAFGEYGKHYDIMIDGALINKLFEQFKKK